MKFYNIKNGYDPKDVGCFPQSTQMGCDYNHASLTSINNVNSNEVPFFTPFTGCFVLRNCAKLTDFISAAILPTGFIVSGRVKNVLEQFRLGRHAFFATQVSHKNKLYNDYFWFIFEPMDLSNFLNYSKTKFYLTDFNGNKIRTMNIASAIELKDNQQIVAEETNGANYISSDKYSIKNNILDSFDIWILPIYPFDILVSNRLVESLNGNNITGINIKERNWFSPK